MPEVVFIIENDGPIKANYEGFTAYQTEIDLYLSFDNISGFKENAASQNASTISRLFLDELEANFPRKNPNALNSLMQTLLREANGKKLC